MTFINRTFGAFMHMRKQPFLKSLLTSCFVLSISAPLVAEEGEVNVYSYRQPELVKPLFDAFTEQTGIKVNSVFAPKGLVERVRTEGESSPVDVIMTVDISRLASAKDAGVTQPVSSEVINKAIPETFRDKDGHWFGLTIRSRVLYASKERVSENALTYADLAKPEWKGRVCTRSGQHVYTLGLIASIIAHEGEDAAKNWLIHLRDNLARKPKGNDRAQAQAIFSGQCDVSLGNTYYMGLMQTNEKKPEQKEWANKLKIIFPNREGRGSHVNISGMALAKHAPNRDNALKLMAYLASDGAQKLYGETNFEYPVKPSISASERVLSWGTLKPDTLSLNSIADKRKKASMLVDEVRFDDGPQH